MTWASTEARARAKAGQQANLFINGVKGIRPFVKVRIALRGDVHELTESVPNEECISGAVGAFDPRKV